MTIHVEKLSIAYIDYNDIPHDDTQQNDIQPNNYQLNDTELQLWTNQHTL